LEKLLRIIDEIALAPIPDKLRLCTVCQPCSYKML
jgi:hypothetical protein